MTYRVHGHGRLDWTTLRRRLDGATCLWADFSGVRTGQAPEHPPPFTHLWAWWPGRRWARVRVDADDGVLGTLEKDGAEGEPVDVVIEHVTSWPADLTRVGPLPAELAGAPMTVLRTVEPAALRFLEIPNASDHTHA